jgi:hypothetical protein
MPENHGWYLRDWNEEVAKSRGLPKMSEEDIVKAVDFLRTNNYPKPLDCLKGACPKLRPTCNVDVCYIAIRMCNDY